MTEEKTAKRGQPNDQLSAFFKMLFYLPRPRSCSACSAFTFFSAGANMRS